MQHRYIFILLMSLLLKQAVSYARVDTSGNKPGSIPDHLHLQFAGNVGFLAAGAGYDLLNNKWQLTFLYGYVPASLAKKYIHLLTVKNTLDLFQIRFRESFMFISYAGFTGTAETGNNSFLVLPDPFPKGYYYTNALHFIFLGGLKAALGNHEKYLLGRTELYLEAGAADTFLYYKLIGREVKFNQIFSMALGINFLLR